MFLTQLFLVMRLLAQADVIFGSAVSLLDVAKILFYLLPSLLSYGMPVAFLLGILVGLGRLAEDRELVALAGTGHGPHLFLPTPLVMGAVLTLFMISITAHFEPVGLKNARTLMNAVIKRNLAGDVKPGVFYEDLSDLTLFAERVDRTDGTLHHVLVEDVREQRAPILVLARSGKIDTSGPGGALTLRLSDGELHRSTLRSDDYTLAKFETAKVAVIVEQEISRKVKLRRPMEHLTPREILQDAAYWAAAGRPVRDRLIEFHRRFAHPFVMLAFAVVGVAVAGAARSGRRGGRGIAFAWTLSAVVAYFVLGKLFTTLGVRGVLPPFLAAWMPVLVIGGLGAGFFLFRRQRGGGG